MLTTREKVLVEGEHDWVALDKIHTYVGLEDPGASLPDVQRRTLELVRSMFDDGLIVLGNTADGGSRFVEWDISVDVGIARLAVSYIDRFNDRAGWPWTVWIAVTEKGKQAGRASRAEYDRWLADIRSRDVEYEALPLHLAPRGLSGASGRSPLDGASPITKAEREEILGYDPNTGV